MFRGEPSVSSDNLTDKPWVRYIRELIIHAKRGGGGQVFNLAFDGTPQVKCRNSQAKSPLVSLFQRGEGKGVRLEFLNLFGKR